MSMIKVPEIVFGRSMCEVHVHVRHGGIYPNPIIVISQHNRSREDEAENDDDEIELQPEQVSILIDWLQAARSSTTEIKNRKDS